MKNRPEPEQPETWHLANICETWEEFRNELRPNLAYSLAHWRWCVDNERPMHGTGWMPHHSLLVLERDGW